MGRAGMARFGEELLAAGALGWGVPVCSILHVSSTCCRRRTHTCTLLAPRCASARTKVRCSAGKGTSPGSIAATASATGRSGGLRRVAASHRGETTRLHTPSLLERKAEGVERLLVRGDAGKCAVEGTRACVSLDTRRGGES